MATIKVPDFNFSSFYYPQILEALTLFKRRDVPELTDESEFEPFMQLLSAFALVGHMNNVLLDVIANESTLPTAKLAETIRNMLRLIDYELKPATRAETDMVYELSRGFNTSFDLIPARAQVATRRTDGGDTPLIYFEALNALSITRTDRLTAVLGFDGTNYTNFATQANAGTNFQPVGAGPITEEMKIYFGHDSVMWDTLSIIVAVQDADISGVWEFYDGNFLDAAVDSVLNLGFGQIEHDLTTLLGPQRRSGAAVRIQFNDTGAYEDVISDWDGLKNTATTGLLGQPTPSLNPDDYTAGVDWQELSSVADGTVNFSQSGTVEFDLPQDDTKVWKKTEVDGIEAYWIRYRIIEVMDTNTPTLALCRIDTGKQFVLAPVIQGRSVIGETVGSSNGEANQRFTMLQKHFILNSDVVEVSGEEWTKVTTFLQSGSQDKHYRIELGEDNKGIVVFGDGTSGKIPQIGQNNIVVEYRWNAESDGNVGSETLVVDKTGLTYINSMYNPRQALGWAEAQSASEDALTKAKEDGPATLRIREVALGPDDLEELIASIYVNDDGASPFSRARAIEEGFGPKTVEAIVVARGGGLATTPQLDALKLWLNGDKTSVPPKRKRFVANQEATPVNFEERFVAVNALVYAPEEVTRDAVVNQLALVLQPEAKKDDGTWAWEFGGEVPKARLIHEIFKTDNRITNVIMIDPASDLALGTRQLPKPGTFQITMIRP